MSKVEKPKSEDELPPKEAQKRFERTVKNMLNTPPKKHEPIGKPRPNRVKK